MGSAFSRPSLYGYQVCIIVAVFLLCNLSRSLHLFYFILSRTGSSCLLSAAAPRPRSVFHLGRYNGADLARSPSNIHIIT
ncbi:hypothetical protein J3F83DRAFT_737886 [Trichoderma novae-zelandiae]